MFVPTTSNKYHGLQKTYQRLYHSSFEIYFRYLKWVSHGFSFGYLVWEISSIEATCVWKTSVCTSLELRKPFFHSLGHHREIMLYWRKFLFNISNESSTEFNFITYIKIYEWICSKTSTSPKTIFFTFMKSYCNHGYGLTTQNPWLWVNHIKPTVMYCNHG